MKLRRAAVLALVGWVMILPPAKTGGGGANVNAPLGAWMTGDIYRSKKSCEIALQKDRKVLPGRFREAAKKGQVDQQTVNWLIPAYAAARCVSSDDPRLSWIEDEFS